MSKVSIIIPVYNQAQYLPDAIQSALDQTIPCEVIVINDGSKDTSLEVAKRFPVKVVNQINKGLPTARNAGIMNATGDYIMPLDADDILLENCCEKLLDLALSTGSDVVSPSLKTFGVQNSESILMANPTLEDFKKANRIPYCSLIKKETLLEVGGYSPRMYWGWEDFALWFDLLKRNKKIITTPDILALYRTKENSMYTESLKYQDQLMSQIVLDNPEIWPELQPHA